MKKILGLDLGTTSIGWALVNEAENENEKSEIVKLGVRVNPLTIDEQANFEKGKPITTNADRTLKRSMRRNLQRYKLRREDLIEMLKRENFITNETILSENGNKSTFETFRLRAKAAENEISLMQFARVLLMINKKRGYKSSRKAKSSEDEGQAIDGMEAAKKLYDENLTPAQFCLEILNKNAKTELPDFYRSDLQAEFDKIWTKQKEFYSEILTNELKDKFIRIENKNGKIIEKRTNEGETWKICEKPFSIVGGKRSGSKDEQKKENFEWRVNALSQKLDLEKLAVVFQKINSQINSSSGYLGAISDRSKELYFNKQTIGQYQMEILNKNPHTSLKNMVFYRQDYLDEFEKIWETQAKFHSKLTDELKKEIRDIVIFYQRKLKSQKGLISFCEFESRKIEVEIDGKKKTITTGNRVIPRSSPLFQEFKIWQKLNDIEIIDNNTGEIERLSKDEKEKLAEKLKTSAKLSAKDVLKTLFDKKAENYKLKNFEEIQGNMTGAKISSILGEVPPNLFDIWHLLYSWEGENKDLATKLKEKFGFDEEKSKKLANISLEDDYGSLSAKAIKKILPLMKTGQDYATACANIYEKHSKSSLTKEEIENKPLKDKLEILPKNSLRNPVVEKILNQMVNVVNEIIENNGKPDEIRIELARELKKNAKQREDLTKSIAETTKLHEEYKKILEQSPFNLQHISRNDIIRYKLYKELEANDYKTLYSNTYISQEYLFSGKFDIEHIIPQSRLFDDSFSNKTLELRDINLEKGNRTAIDFVKEKYGETETYLSKIEKLFKDGKITRAKYNKLKMSENEIPDGFINRDLNETQYIAKYAKEMLSDLVKVVVSTTGSITDRLREDWQLVDVMKELNFEKYKELGLVEDLQDKNGKPFTRIKDWNKRNDHRHHAMDALTVAFTKQVFVQYFNTANASCDTTKNEYAIKQKYFDGNKVKSPIPLNEFRAEAKKHLENTLISIKAKNKVATKNINKTKKKSGENKKTQFTPRGQLHNESIYGSMKQAVVKIDKKTGKKIVEYETIYTIRKNISPDLKIEKVVDLGIKRILEKRLQEYGGDAKKAFVNLEENPIWLNKEKGISIKSVTITAINNAVALHSKRDKDGKLILDENGKEIPVDFVSTSNNHHIAIYRDKDGKLQESVVSFFEAIERKNKGLPIINKEHKDKNGNRIEGSEFLFSMKQNEYFVFPNEQTEFDPTKIDLLDPKNYTAISPNLFRGQKFSISGYKYVFRHHLETNVDVKKELNKIAYKQFSNLMFAENIVKVRVNHIGQIVSTGEY